MSMGNEPAYPVDRDTVHGERYNADGLTKRELFAAMAMQSLISERCYPIDPNMPRYAIAAADALLAELERTA